MRLKKLEQVQVGDMPDLMRLLSYRPELFGEHFQPAIMQEVMRGPSDWSVGERELFAAFVSRKNQCPFCKGIHSAVASKALTNNLVQVVLDDWRTAPIDEKLRAAFGFLEKLTLIPGDVGPDDIMPLRVAGVSEQAIEDALSICMLFTIINRLADSLSFAVPPTEVMAQLADFLLEHGYPPPIRSS